MTKTPIYIRVDDETKLSLDEWAKKESRSLSNLINLILKQAVERKASE